MKIVILNVQAPFIRGGAEYLADSLHVTLSERGHQVETVRIPFKWYPLDEIPRHMLACRLIRLDAGERADLVIAMKFPSYLVPAESKKLWLLHQFRQAYDAWGTPFGDLPDTPEGRGVRDIVVRSDNLHLPEAREIYTNSHIVAARLKQFNGIEATGVLYPPLLDAERFRATGQGDYFFYPSRVVASKRQEVAIEAMRHVRSNLKLVLAGSPETEAHGAHLRRLIEQYELGDRVTMLGWISEEEKARLMGDAFAALYLPYNEDSYGFVTLEAFHSHKPLITFTDSGGTDELIEDGRNGLVVEPDPHSLAAAMERLWAEKAATEAMGERAFGTLAEHRISWDYVVERLTS